MQEKCGSILIPTHPDTSPCSNIQTPFRAIQGCKVQLIRECDAEEVMLQVKAIGFALVLGQSRLLRWLSCYELLSMAFDAWLNSFRFAGVLAEILAEIASDIPV